MIDRGFIKWQPFNSVISNKTVLTNLTKSKNIIKPILSNEQIEELNKLILEAYYGQNKIEIYFYEHNKINSIKTVIKKIEPNSNILELENHKIITFQQILKIYP